MLQTCDILLSKPIGATSNHQPLCLARFRSQHWRQSTCGFHYWEMQCPIVWLDGIISWTQEFEYINFSLLEATNSIHLTLALEGPTVLVFHFRTKMVREK